MAWCNLLSATAHVVLLRSAAFSLTVGLLCISGSIATAAPPASGDAKPLFEQKVAALLQQRCAECHNGEAREGNLDLSSAAGLLKGSDSGPVIAAGDRDKSLLYEAVHDGAMPPEGEPLSDSEIALIGDWIAAGARFRDPPSAAANAPSQHDVVFVLLLRCATCHGAELQRGGLDLRSLKSLAQGGDSGPAMVAGDPDGSLMIQRVEQELCPPQNQLLKYFVRRPSTSEVAKLREWIAARAPIDDPTSLVADPPDPSITDEDRGHWAFQPLPQRVPVPAFSHVELPQPIDAFVYGKLQQKGLGFSPPASRPTLIRRVYLNLTGLPPSPDQLRRWMEHPGDTWYAQMVDHLLQSPRYGERWGRYWLDVAGYADSEGGVSADVMREVAWKYRDYVIRSFNDDKPWDRFLLEQIAGDELADYTDPAKVTDEITDNLIATGFLRMPVDQTGSRTMNFVPERLGLISDALTVVSSGVMGLTMECARCHSHKYDPIPHRDYYRMKAIFQGAYDEHDWMSWKTRKLEVASPEAVARYESTNPPLEKEIQALEAQRRKAILAIQDPIYKARWPQVPEAVQQETLAALKATPGRLTLREEELKKRYETELRPTETVLRETHSQLDAELETIDGRIAQLRQKLLPPLTVRALWDRGRPSPTYLLVRGEHDRPGPPVQPGVPWVLTDGTNPIEIAPPWDGAPSTGRRAAFARWLTKPDHPLTARVIVNRVWSLHFGRGIVKTLDNFGRQGAAPTHLELLDWLARAMVDGGWSMKALHRTILLSRTYQQSSLRTPELDTADPENQWLARMSMRRLDAEALHDSILAVAGRLDDQLFGPPAPVTVRADGLIMQRGTEGGFRRSLYMQHRRTEMPSLLSTFDYPEMQPNCSERSVSTVSLQPLVLLNNADIHAWASDFANRVLWQASDDSAEWIDAAYQMALCRLPTSQERHEAVAALAELQRHWQQAAHVRRPDAGATAATADASSIAGTRLAQRDVKNALDHATFISLPGPATNDGQLDGDEVAARRALATFCHMLLNSAEFLYVD